MFQLDRSVACVMVLEWAYQTNPYPNRFEIGKIARQLNLEAIKVRNWFATQRAKDTCKNKLCRRCRFFKSPIDKLVHDQDWYSYPCVAYFLTNRQNQRPLDESVGNFEDLAISPCQPGSMVHWQLNQLNSSNSRSNSSVVQYAATLQENVDPNFSPVNCTIESYGGEAAVLPSLQMIQNSEHICKFSNDSCNLNMNQQTMFSAWATWLFHAHNCHQTWVDFTKVNPTEQQFYQS